MTAVITAEGLTRRFGKVVAVDGVGFEVPPGEIFGFLGPNGAGKTTTVRMLTGAILPTSGTATVAGHDVVREGTAAREHIAVVPEQANVYIDLSVRRNVLLMAELHGVPRRERMRRADALLEDFGLADRAGQIGKKLSKGLRQRLMLCMALVSAPEILFLDEPTGGLDVASARLIRERVLAMNRERGTTVFLTSHNMDEVDQLCGRIAVISHGRIAAVDAPDALRGRFEERRSVEVTFEGAPPGVEVLRDVAAGGDVTSIAGGFRVYTTAPGRVAQELVGRATAAGARIASVRTCGPSLEDVFLRLTADDAGEERTHD